MSLELLSLLTIAILIVAFLYSAVGHAGASGYIAVMSLFSLAPAVIKPTALILNVLVACIGAWQFWRMGYFSWRLFWPFGVLAIPMAFVGGYVDLPTHVFKLIVGVILLFTAIRFLRRSTDDSVVKEPPHALAILLGGGLGLLSGLTGTGGGIFLTPLLLFMRWAKAKPAAAVSAFFILFNSIAGLLGNISSAQLFPPYAIFLVIGAISGGTIGSYYGSQRLEHATIKRLLAIVLFIAGTKLILI